MLRKSRPIGRARRSTTRCGRSIASLIMSIKSIVTVLPVAESGVPAGQATVAGLEHALLGEPHVIGVGGDGASLIDFDHAVYGNFPLMLAVIGAATFLLLIRAVELEHMVVEVEEVQGCTRLGQNELAPFDFSLPAIDAMVA